MKRLLPIILAVSPIFSLANGDSEPPRLIGFLNNDFGVLEVNEVVPTASITRRRQVILKEGQSDFGLQLIKILPEKEAVKVLVSGGTITTIKLKNNEASASFSPKGIALENANLETVLKLYGELSKRTVLKYPALPDVNLGLKCSTTNQSETIRLIETALAEQRISVVLDGEKFVLVANKDRASSLKPKSSAIPQFSTNASRADALPKGAIHFEGASVEQVLPIYAEIYGKKLDRSASLPRGTPNYIYLITQTELTKGEVLYAMETLLAWHGIKVMPSGDGLLKAVAAIEQ